MGKIKGAIFAANVKRLAEVAGLELQLLGKPTSVDFTVVLNGGIELQSHDDGEVHLTSQDKKSLYDLLTKVFARQGFDSKLLFDVISRPNLYHKLERPDKIVSSYKTFEEVIDAI